MVTAREFRNMVNITESRTLKHSLVLIRKAVGIDLYDNNPRVFANQLASKSSDLLLN